MDIIFKQYDARRDRFEEGALTSEARYLETIAIWDAILSFENPAKSLFGLEAFHSMGGYGAGRFRGRQAHVDYNLILVTNGLVGLFLYLNIYFTIYRYYMKKTIKGKISNSHHNQSNKNKEKIFIAVFWALFLTSMFTSLGGHA